MRITVDKTKAKPSPPENLEERVKRLEAEMARLSTLVSENSKTEPGTSPQVTSGLPQ